MKKPGNDINIIIVVVNYNKYTDTIECLESLLDMDYLNFKIFVVDNSENDVSINKMERWARGNDTYIYNNAPISISIHPKPVEYLLIKEGESVRDEKKNYPLTIIKARENNGFAAANNIAIKHVFDHQLKCDWFWLLNNDTVIPPMVLKNFSEFVHNLPTVKIGMIGTNLYYYDSPYTLQGIGAKYRLLRGSALHLNNVPEAPDKRSAIFEREANYIIGASMFVSPAFINDVGLMEEDYFLYCEEIDWAVRGKKRGWRLSYCPTSDVYHKEGQSIGSASTINQRSDLAEYYDIRNKLVFIKKHYPWLIPIRLFTLFGTFCVRIVRGRLRRASYVARIILRELFTHPKKTKKRYLNHK